MFVLATVSTMYMYYLIFHPDVIKRGYEVIKVMNEKNFEIDFKKSDLVEIKCESESEIYEKQVEAEFEFLNYDNKLKVD
jgi:hypothetical protein